jgi:small subunit ribosomal protein S4
MTRITCKRCRRLGESLCGREKCAFKKRPFAPGILDSQRKHKSSKSEYGEQLKEKQKIRVSYGMREKQFRSYIDKAIAAKGKNTQEMIYSNLESRLDNVVYRSGLANTRALARQIVNHGHITVNGRKLNIPSYQVKVDDEISIRPGSKVTTYFVKLLEKFDPQTPVWITSNKDAVTFKIKSLPKEVEATMNFEKVIEFYNR